MLVTRPSLSGDGVITTLSEVDEAIFVVRWIAASEYVSERQNTKQPWEPYNSKEILRCMAPSHSQRSH